MSEFEAEVRRVNKSAKLAEKNNKDRQLHFEMGNQAGWRGVSVDDIPRFKKNSRSAAWLDGHSKATNDKLLQAEHSKIDKAGLRRIKDIIEEALKNA